ncbi:MAG TPA: hypothetical protein DEB06_08160 [Phycisphaerales bacterium]|nr:hypothetical protein [Phycisphaerales bacterium]
MGTRAWVRSGKSRRTGPVDSHPVRERPLISVIVPTRNRAGALTRLLERLTVQTMAPERFEVIVVHDGPDEASSGAALAFAPRLAVTDLTAPRLGVSAARNEALAHARGGIVLLLNDDVLPAPDLLEVHRRAHDERGDSAPPALVLGHSPFVEQPAPSATLFDRLMERTGAVFFYDRMIDARGRVLRPADHDWGYRHAWTLNLSFPARVARLAGGFRPAIANWCYEDVEFAWRASRTLGSPVLFRPGALAPHDHRLSPADYLAREHRLGYSAPGFALAAPDCARELFGREVLTEEAWYARAFIERESRDEPRHARAFEAMCALSASLAEGPTGEAILGLASAQHLALKRLAFRRGLIDALDGRRIEGLFLPSDGLSHEPGAPRRSAA